MIEERRVVFSVVRHYSDQPMLCRSGPARVEHRMEHVTQFKPGSHRAEDVHDVVQLGSLRVPDDADRDDVRPVHQGTADLDPRAAGTLWGKRGMWGVSCAM